MKTIFFNRVLLSHQALCIGTATFLAIWGLWLICPPAVADSSQILAPQTKIELIKSGKHWIEINLSTQRLFAWEGKKLIKIASISSGKPSTPTIPGLFKIETKHLRDRMRGVDYDIADVPYTMYYNRGYAIHGAPWHNRFGTPISHGCINLPVNTAKWLYEWTSPGTSVFIH
jgi:lipoprotein-anchoring transpeptidase ErfK/SrfK